MTTAIWIALAAALGLVVGASLGVIVGLLLARASALDDLREL